MTDVHTWDGEGGIREEWKHWMEERKGESGPLYSNFYNMAAPLIC